MAAVEAVRVESIAVGAVGNTSHITSSERIIGVLVAVAEVFVNVPIAQVVFGVGVVVGYHTGVVALKIGGSTKTPRKLVASDLVEVLVAAAAQPQSLPLLKALVAAVEGIVADGKLPALQSGGSVSNGFAASGGYGQKFIVAEVAEFAFLQDYTSEIIGKGIGGDGGIALYRLVGKDMHAFF